MDGGGPRSAVGVAMEEEGVVVEVARCVCLIFFGVFIFYHRQVSLHTCLTCHGISTPEVCYHMYVG